MSKQNKVEETKVVTMEESETETADVEAVEESIEKESKIKKLWGKIKKPLIIGGAAIGGFILGAKLGNKDDDDDYVVYDLDSEVVDEDETEE